MLWQLIVLLCSDLIPAGRPGHGVLDDDLTLRVRGKCPQEVPLRAVLTRLLVKDVEDLLHKTPVVTWNGCSVKTIRLDGRKEVQGPLDERIAELTELSRLDLHDTNVTGDLKVLVKNTKLDYLHLRHTQVTGDLSSLSQATELTYLNLRDTQVTGDLRGLSQATGLRSLHLVNTRVTGDLGSLSQATSLTFLYLQNTQVAGDLSGLSRAAWLANLDLQNTQVAGDVGGLSGAARLTNLDLSDTQVAGDLSGLRAAKELRILHLRNTRVTGDLSALVRTLSIINLQNTQVAGELSSLAGAPVLQTLNLQNTRVTGVLSGLFEAPGLRHLNLQNTRVAGNISALQGWSKLQTAELSRTQVSGRIDRSWKGCCQQLQALKLAETKVSFRVDVDEESWMTCHHHLRNCFLPKLVALDLSGAPLNYAITELFRDLNTSPSLAALKAANAGLSGEVNHLPVAVVDLSSNKLTHVAALPPFCQSFTARDNDGDLTFGEEVLGKAISDGISVDLWNVTFDPTEESARLLDRKLLTPTERRVVYNEDRGFACYDVLPKSFQVSPELFAPERLCSCLPGWHGSGTTCQLCPKNTFKDSFEGTCQQCPEGSQADPGAKSLTQCRCRIGEVFNESGVPRCRCPREEAQKGDLCVKCHKLNWNCSEPGSEVLSAKPLPGFARLGNQTRAFKCFPPDERCSNNEPAEESGCFTGYMGILCGQCRPGFYSSRDACERCTTALILPNVYCAWYAAGCAMMLALVGGLLWLRNQGQEQDENPDTGQRQRGFGVLKHQLKVQAPILLQLCQLWSVVAALSSGQEEEGSDNIKEPAATSLWELPYIQALQLSLSNLKGVFNLQCHYDDGPTVRWAFALLAPAFPIAVLVLSLGLEFARRGLGVSVALQVIAFLYIGGASSSSNLLSCQGTDGLGEQLPKNFAFRSAIPEILCDEESAFKAKVDMVAYITAFGYAVVVPCCLLYLYARQHLLLRRSRMTTTFATHQDDLKVTLKPVLKSGKPTPEKQEQWTRHTVASTAAYISLTFRGPLSLRMEEGQMVVQMLEGCSLTHGEVEMNISDVGTFLDEDEVQQARILRCRAISEMLMERSTLHEVAPSERILLGAQNLLSKYAFGRNVFLEIVQKLVAVALVSTVSSPDGLKLALGITLTTAAMVALVQPYLKPQANTLLACCYLCLAVAAWAFDRRVAWLSRAALALPFLLTLLQSLTPDGAETRALRIWEEDLEPQVQALQEGKAVEITAERRTISSDSEISFTL
ncbi:unnamed protein product [Effrenium voratum]|nr:unnamed protein product [Effrenium voratum]